MAVRKLIGTVCKVYEILSPTHLQSVRSLMQKQLQRQLQVKLPHLTELINCIQSIYVQQILVKWWKLHVKHMDFHHRYLYIKSIAY